MPELLRKDGTAMVNEYIKSDLYRYYGKYSRFILWKALLRNSTFRFQYVLRLCQDHGIRKKAGLFLWNFNRTKKTIQISWNTKIGYGLFIPHGGPLVVNPSAVIGDNCNLSQFVTIGSNHGKAAVIGNDVYIGPNVCIVENVSIGNKVTIGAGSVVTKDIPENATAAGNYAKVLNYENPGRYIKKRYSYEQTEKGNGIL